MIASIRSRQARFLTYDVVQVGHKLCCIGIDNANVLFQPKFLSSIPSPLFESRMIPGFIPKLDGKVRFEAMSASTRIVNYEFTCDPPPERRVTLIYVELPPFDYELSPRQLHREELQYESQRNGELPGSYSRGTRFGSTFAVWVEQLGCEIISGWSRQEMR